MPVSLKSMSPKWVAIVMFVTVNVHNEAGTFVTMSEPGEFHTVVAFFCMVISCQGQAGGLQRLASGDNQIYDCQCDDPKN